MSSQYTCVGYQALGSGLFERFFFCVGNFEKVAIDKHKMGFCMTSVSLNFILFLFIRTCDACQILKQPSSYIDHLQSTLQLCINGEDESAYQEVMALLREKQVSFLGLEEILKVTTLLID